MTNSTNKGWVRLHRKIEDNFLWLLEPFTKGQAWVDLFLNANHKDGKMCIRGNTIEIKRGQIGWSELTMAKRWKWSKNRVRRFLKLLEMEQQIIQQKDRYITTIITILKYEEHQNDTADGTAERQQKDSRRYINKNDKNEKNVKNTMQPAVADPINELIKMFEPVNPSYKQLYPIKTQRSCLERLLKLMGREKLEGAIRTLPRTNKMDYAPVITSPYELEKKMGSLIAFVQKEKGKTIKNNIAIL
jgi:hypothetical protein